MYLCCWHITLCCHCTALFPLQSRNLGPGTYRLDLGVFDSKSVSERAKGPGWKRAYDSVQLATIPHMLYKEQWEQKRLLEEKRGPGVYDTKDLVDVLNSRPSSKLGVCSTRVPRFRIESQVCSVRLCVCAHVLYLHRGGSGICTCGGVSFSISGDAPHTLTPHWMQLALVVYSWVYTCVFVWLFIICIHVPPRFGCVCVCLHCSFGTPFQALGPMAREETPGPNWRKGIRGPPAPWGCWTMEGWSSGNCPPL